VRSPSDAPTTLQVKLQEYVDNGARLGGLLNPERRRVHVYRPSQPVEVLANPAHLSGDLVLPGLGLDLPTIW
jgi:Uma2 family endonuclease